MSNLPVCVPGWHLKTELNRTKNDIPHIPHLSWLVARVRFWMNFLRTMINMEKGAGWCKRWPNFLLWLMPWRSEVIKFKLLIFLLKFWQHIVFGTACSDLSEAEVFCRCWTDLSHATMVFSLLKSSQLIVRWVCYLFNYVVLYSVTYLLQSLRCFAYYVLGVIVHAESVM